MQIFSRPVTAALQFMKDQAGYTGDIEFSTVGPTVQFMEEMHTHKNDPDTRQFSDPNDPMLEWLEDIQRPGVNETSCASGFCSRKPSLSSF